MYQEGDMAIKTIYGQVGYQGEVLEGTGFQSSRIAQGIYVIDFTQDFSSIPSVTVSPVDSNTNHNYIRDLSVNVPNNGQVTVYSFRKWAASDTTAIDTIFNFIAVGEE